MALFILVSCENSVRHEKFLALLEERVIDKVTRLWDVGRKVDFIISTCKSHHYWTAGL